MNMSKVKANFQAVSRARLGWAEIHDRDYLDIRRDDDVVFIQIFLNEGRPVEVKQALYARIAELLAEDPGVREEDILIKLVKVPKENWSYGNGIA
jgi:4-oxalocrotonate tautomerase